MTKEKTYQELEEELLKKRNGQQKGYRNAVRNLLSFARKSGDTSDSELARAYYYMGEFCFASMVEYESTGYYMRKSLYYADRAGDYGTMSQIYNVLGIDASTRGLLEIGVQYYSQSRSYASRQKDPKLLAKVNFNLGFEYYRLDDFKGAIECYRTALSDIKKSGNDRESLNIIYIIYCEMGLSYVEMGNYRKALTVHRQMDALVEHYGTVTREAADSFIVDLFRLAIARYEADEDACAAIEKQLLQNLEEATVHMDSIPETLNMIVREIQSGNSAFAEAVIRAGLSIVEEHGSPYVKSVICQQLARYAEFKKRPERRIYYLERYFEEEQTQEKIRKSTFRIYMQMVNTAEEIQKKNIELERQAHTDVLTGIPNRLSLNEFLQDHFDNAQLKGRTLGVEIFDIDCFKSYNDTYGHQTGDRCLAKIGELLRSIISDRVFAARYGGDEFVLVFLDFEDREILDFARELKKRAGDLKVETGRGKSIRGISISQGIRNSVPTKHNKSWDFLTAADNALYTLKKKSKGDILLLHRAVFSEEESLTDAVSS